MRVAPRQFTTAAVTLLAIAPLGCTTLPDISAFSDKSAKSESSFLDRLPFPGKKKEHEKPEPYPNPVKIVATWTPDTLMQTGRTPTRGFGGRVFFYDEKSRPVPVEGTLTVHGFDDGSPEPEKNVKRFEFTPAQFTRHYSQSDLGASYSIWIPWDAVGGQQRRVSLVTSFKSAEGNIIQGVPATLALPGKSPETEEGEPVAKLSPQYQRYLDATASPSTRQTGLTTTTIRHSRSGSPAQPTKPGVTTPALRERRSMIADGQTTPSADIKMAKRPARSSVVPASAQLPIQ